MRLRPYLSQSGSVDTNPYAVQTLGVCAATSPRTWIGGRTVITILHAPVLRSPKVVVQGVIKHLYIGTAVADILGYPVIGIVAYYTIA